MFLSDAFNFEFDLDLIIYLFFQSYEDLLLSSVYHLSIKVMTQTDRIIENMRLVKSIVFKDLVSIVLEEFFFFQKRQT